MRGLYKRVIVESPYAGDLERNIEYAKRCMLDSIQRGESPLLSHLLYTQVLDDGSRSQRKRGINCGLSWGVKADTIAVYRDFGITDGMQQAIEFYNKKGIEIDYRSIGREPMIEPISIIVFKWKKPGYRTEFKAEHVNNFFKMIDKHVTVPHKKICITDDQEGINKDIHTIHLWENPCPRYGNEMKPNCFYRLRLFDPQKSGIPPEAQKIIGSRFVWMDLDAVIVKNIDNILVDSADLKMWKVDGEYMPCNGSLLLHKIGTKTHYWGEFNPNRIHPVTGLRAHGMIGSDQAYIATKLTDDEKQNTFGKESGVYSFRCHLKEKNVDILPKAARIVFFHGTLNPWSPEVQEKYKWVKEHYPV